MNAPPCTDLALEAAYVRSCYGARTSRKYTHLADAAARLDPRDCFSDAHGHLLAAFYALVDGKIRLEPQRLRVQLEQMHPRTGAATFDAFSALVAADTDEEVQPSWAASQLRELARRRRKRETLARAVAALDRGDDEAADEHVLSVESEETEAREAEFQTAGEATRAAVAAAAQTRVEGAARRTGHPRIDQALGAFRPQTMTILGGTTGSGKSSLLLSWAVNMARRGLRVGIISTEDASSVWGERLVGQLEGINPQAMHGECRHLDARIARAHARADSLGLHLAYELNRPLNDVLRAMRHLSRKHGCQVIGVDYVQAIASTGARVERRDFIARAAAAIKAQGQELGASLVLCSQLSRPPKDRPFGEVYTSDLKESGDLENMAEAVVLLWKSGDSSDSPTLGKVAKVKWSQERPRFAIVRDDSGSVVGLGEYEQPAGARNGKGARHAEYD